MIEIEYNILLLLIYFYCSKTRAILSYRHNSEAKRDHQYGSCQ